MVVSVIGGGVDCSITSCEVVSRGDVVVAGASKTSPKQGLAVFEASTTHAPLIFRYPGPQSHRHDVSPPDQHQLYVDGATQDSQPRLSDVHAAALRCPTLQLESDVAHGLHSPSDMTYPALQITLQLASYVLSGIKSAVHGLHTASADSLHGMNTL